MNEEEWLSCVDCQGRMSPVIIMDKVHSKSHRYTTSLEYRLPDDRLNFWTSKYPTAGPVQAYMCEECGRIELYGGR